MMGAENVQSLQELALTQFSGYRYRRNSYHPGRRPKIRGLAIAPEQVSNVLRTGWIPACAGMTGSLVIPGVDPGSTH